MADPDPYEHAAEQIDDIFASLDDWRGERLQHIRNLIHQARPDVVEAVKWRKPSNPEGVPIFEVDGIVCHAQAFKGKVKVTFAKGASLDDPKGVFNASLEANVSRAIDLGEHDDLDEAAFKEIFAAAAALNEGS